jgi:hypothetical protein
MIARASAEILESVPKPRDGWADALAEAAELRGATAMERHELLAAACEAVFEILSSHERQEDFLAYQEPLSAETQALIRRARDIEPI